MNGTSPDQHPNILFAIADDAAGREYNARRLTPPDRTHISDIDHAANFGDFLIARESGRPFCFWYGSHEPHRCYEPG